MKIHHIGYLVKNIEKAASSFEKQGFEKEGECVYDSIRDIDILFMKNEETRIELVSPKSEHSLVFDLLKKNGTGPYHICYECEDLEEGMERMRGAGFTPTDEPLPAPALSGNRVVFLFSRVQGLIELLEVKDAL